MSAIFALGSGGSGQLGIGRVEEKLGVPTRCLFESDPVPSATAVALAGGGNHTLILFSDGSLFAAGDNKHGACGHGKLTDLLEFHPVVTRDSSGSRIGKIKAIAATWASSIVVTEQDRIFVFGQGSKGELGLGPEVTRAENPTELLELPLNGRKILQLTASIRHALVLLDDGSIWGWGASRHGQLGAADCISGAVTWTPIKILNLSHAGLSATSAGCGNGFSGILGAANDGQTASPCLVVLGSDKHGIISGKPNILSQHMRILTTWTSIYLHDTDSGRVTCWGRDAKLPVHQTGLPPVRRLKTGSEHAAAELHDGRIIAWGWNEHQNCGTGPGPAGSFNYNIIAEDANARLLGCGCATTFIKRDNDTP